MFSKPLISGLSDKFYDLALIITVTLMYIGLCAEADMYVPAFPQMINYFKVAENEIQLILSINFGGLCVAGFLAGPLSDAYGRRSVLIAGLGLFVISSFGCLYTADFRIMLFWRLVQGVSASVPMVVGCAAIMDKYTQEKAGQLIGVINSVISASMAGAPIAGAWISEYWDWHGNFLAILILAFVTFAGTLLFLEETLPEDKRRRLNLKSAMADYTSLLQNFNFMAYATLGVSAFVAIVIYVANLSVIFVNYMGMDLVEFSYWQASTMSTFIFFSLLSTKLIAWKGLDYTKNLGSLLAFIGSFSLFLTGHFAQGSAFAISISMALVSAGGAIFAGAYGVKSMAVANGMHGAASAMMTAIRQLAVAGFVVLSEVMFSGTITPVGNIIFAFTIVCVILYFAVLIKNKKQ